MSWESFANGLKKKMESTEKEVVKAAVRKIKAMSDSQLLNLYNSGSYDYRIEEDIEREIRRRGL